MQGGSGRAYATDCPISILRKVHFCRAVDSPSDADPEAAPLEETKKTDQVILGGELEKNGH
jgi:hypothetical protein